MCLYEVVLRQDLCLSLHTHHSEEDSTLVPTYHVSASPQVPRAIIHLRVENPMSPITS